MGEYFQKFSNLMSVKRHPSDYEECLFKKTQKYCRYISWIPGLKMVAICNSLSMYSTKTNGSDIDLFIISAPKRLWYVRFMITMIFHLLGVRRHGDKIKERFCLSFFISENAMDFSSFAIQNDIYLFYWIYFLKPIVNKDNAYERFLKANKTLKIDDINLHGDNKAYMIQTGKYIKLLDKCKLLDFKDFLLKKILLPRTLSHKKRLGDAWGLIVSDDILKFTDNDKRIEIRDKILI